MISWGVLFRIDAPSPSKKGSWGYPIAVDRVPPFGAPDGQELGLWKNKCDCGEGMWKVQKGHFLFTQFAVAGQPPHLILLPSK